MMASRTVSLFSASAIVPLSIVLFLTACSGGGGGSAGGNSIGGSGGTTPPPSTANEWTWVSGGNTAATSEAVYGTQGLASASNTPGPREFAVGWTDSSGNLWMFGGGGYNDLWEFSPSTKEWTWMSGEDTQGNSGTWGTQGVASTSYFPGRVEGGVGWTDTSGNLWLFGGSGAAKLTAGDGLNDLWEFNPSTKAWTWVSGSNEANALGAYGTQGSDTPGGRAYATGWTDSGGNFWLFGGYGADSVGTFSYLNDMWEFSPITKQWTWIDGAATANAQGVYGTQGTADSANVPGARAYATSWTDSSGNFWLFGGTNENGGFNDLWEFNPTTKKWTWVSGSNTVNAESVYGTQGVAAVNNVPGAQGAVGWADASGDLWLYGDTLGDLWKFNIASKKWAWMGGNTLNAPAVFGTEGVASPSSTPGYIEGALAWTSGGSFWLFGSGDGTLNTLWRYQP